MAIYVVSVQYNGGFLPGVMMLTNVTTTGEPDIMPRRGFVYAQPMILPRLDVLTFFSLTDGGCLEGLD